MMTSVPSLARVFAIARPMPAVAAVTIAVLPFSGFVAQRFHNYMILKVLIIF
ncbi:hypothetical protein OKC46_10305 [Acinetobacter baumannii]|uniref:hypothetical protein n=1 Tax=Acinetobacter baumannii TaxID=470 RepID=UPI00237F4298|nr:hypothetical protein [Acinetobacter baumannii]MDE3317742.1 hypothetical protein [Acinetobacter baumannii]MDX2338611.1 hypothetical protein [Acinetobacter baumannii]MDX5550353.1 hypothetical protein [Acinetobacter baumannii]